MKKLILSLLIVFATIGLAGCSKKLTCEAKMTEKVDGVEMTNKIEVIFNDKLSEKATIIYIFNDEATANTYYNYMKNSDENYKLDGKAITINKNIGDEEKISYKEAKTQFEDEGYTCK